MVSDRALLLIADISGYTDYMSSHRMSLGHAEANTARLLGKVIDAAHDFDLIEIEGDAAFFSRPAGALDGDAIVRAIMQAAVAMHRVFHTERQHVVTNLCPCDDCAQADNLKLKFVAHIGEVATQSVKRRRTLVGIDVIFVHRLLKNRVPIPEYVLLSEPLYRSGEGALPEHVHAVSEDVEGIGPVRAYFVDLERLAGEAPPEPDHSLLERFGSTVGLVGRGLPYALRVRRPRRTASVH
jgi:hypothetical protein